MNMGDVGVNHDMHIPYLVHCKTTLFNFHIQLKLEVVIHLWGKGNVDQQLPITKTHGNRRESNSFTSADIQENM